MKKYYIMVIFLITLSAVYIVLIGKIDGKYTCDAYTMLDGGYSESYLKLHKNIMSHVYIEPGKTPRIKQIGTYTKTGYSALLVDDSNLGFKYTLDSGVLGLYMRDRDAARLGIKFPKIGNIWCWRSIW